MDGIHTPNDIAVSPTGEIVLVACRSEGTVHCWHRENDRIDYHQISDLDVSNIGMGRISYDKKGFLYVTSTPGGYVNVMKPDFEPVDLLVGGKPSLNNPVSAVPSPDGMYIYILQAGGTTPVKMLQWEKLKKQFE